ncbi:hypothetical protein Sango_0602500 [Sesamum angolense]|uniref:TLDc domain-containing protein n=1 Tax=Sesamum angolense TaxID=2727404 RepID=A0AAE1X659_9LAMI|nr:hypothetical protein Sango_0602500 [Sesamum angolense]
MIKEEKITHDIKDRVSQKLSRFFTASPSSPTPDQESEARPFAEHAKSLSSMVSRLPSASLDWFRQSSNYNGVKPIGSLSLKWRSKSFLRKDKPLDGFTESGHAHDNRAMIKSHEENGEPGSTESPSQNYKSSSSHQESREPGSGRSTSSSGDIASIPHSFSQSMPCLRDESLFISPELYQFLKPSLPNIVKGCQCSVRHGISLRTLIRKSADLSGPCLLITGDMQGAVFGGLLDCPLKPTAVWKYQTYLTGNKSIFFSQQYVVNQDYSKQLTWFLFKMLPAKMLDIFAEESH